MVAQTQEPQTVYLPLSGTSRVLDKKTFFFCERTDVFRGIQVNLPCINVIYFSFIQSTIENHDNLVLI